MVDMTANQNKTLPNSGRFLNQSPKACTALFFGMCRYRAGILGNMDFFFIRMNYFRKSFLIFLMIGITKITQNTWGNKKPRWLAGLIKIIFFYYHAHILSCISSNQIYNSGINCFSKYSASRDAVGHNYHI